jgi:hypothetical protein
MPICRASTVQELSLNEEKLVIFAAPDLKLEAVQPENRERGLGYFSA